MQVPAHFEYERAMSVDHAAVHPGDAATAVRGERRPAGRGVHLRDPADEAHPRTREIAARAGIGAGRSHGAGLVRRYRIGAALGEFNRRYGRPGMARGAVVLIISDGWETGDPAVLRREMARLSRLAYQIVWVNPRTASPRYRPLVGGMATAWPYCDAVVSAHHLDALSDLVDALADPVRRRPRRYRHEEE
jgi:hypothetical protein